MRRGASSHRGGTAGNHHVGLVEAGLRRVLATPDSGDGSADDLPPLPVWNSGGARVDIANRDALYRLMDGY